MTTDKQARMSGGFGAGVGAALGMMLVMAVLRFTTDTISIPELMEESLIRLTGGEVNSLFINNLGVGGKALLLVIIIEGTLLLGGLLGWAFTRFWPMRSEVTGWRWISGLLYGLVIGLLLNVVVLPLVGQGFFGSQALEATAPPDIANALYGSSFAPFGVPVWLNMFLLSIVFGLTMVALLRWNVGTLERSNVITTEPSNVSTNIGRRDFSKVLAGGALALVGGVALWFGIRSALEPPAVAGVQEVDDVSKPPPTKETTTVAQAQPTGEATHVGEMEPTAGMTEVPPTPPVPPGFEGVKPKLVPEVTPTDKFYVTTKNFLDPTVDAKTWKLEFKGLVDNPYSITFDELKAMPAFDRVETLACISNPVGGSLIGNADWRGVDFGELVKRAKPKQGVVDVVVRASDGYSDSFPLSAALNNECVLVYEMNGAPLTDKHGYPARLLVPGIYGMKNCKWLTQVELVNNDYKGYWESQGWSDTALYQTMSRIDYPDTDRIQAKPIYIGGVAFAGDRGIERVEVSTDGGQTWNDAQLRTPMSEYAWTQWTYPWLPEADTYSLQVRATDGKGETQTAVKRGTFPDGATGYHTKQVRVS